MDEFKPKQYLRKQTGLTVTVKEVNYDKIKEIVTVVLADESDALIDARFSLTGEYAAYAKSSMDKLKKALGIESLMKDAVGKKVGIHINQGSEFIYKKGAKAGQKGISFNVAGYFPARNLELDSSIEGPNNEQPDDINF